MIKIVEKEKYYNSKYKDLILVKCCNSLCENDTLKTKRVIYLAILKNKKVFCSPQCKISFVQYTCEKCSKFFFIKKGNSKNPRFCSKSCSNKSRIITKETKAKISNSLKKIIKNEIKCLSCKIDLFNRRHKYCNICRELKYKEKIFIKFNLISKNLQISNQKLIEFLENEYFIKNKSFLDLEKEFKIHHNFFIKFFRTNKLKARTLSDGVNLAIVSGKPMGNSNNKFKHGWHTTWNKKEVFLRSSYEFKLADNFDKLRMDYEVENLRIKYYDSTLEKERIAIPDFFVKDLNTIYEVKGRYKFNLQNMIDRSEEYIKLGYTFKLIYEHQEYNSNDLYNKFIQKNNLTLLK